VDVAVTYRQALSSGDVPALLDLLASAAEFQSPFSLWQGREQLALVYRARALAFADLQAIELLAGGAADTSRAALLWRSVVQGHPVEGCEVLTLAEGRVQRVDVFLRPAPVLPVVHAAMTAAWPR